MSRPEHIIAFASWEERFRIGFDKIVAAARSRTALLYYFEEYAEWTAENRAHARSACERTATEFVEQKLRVGMPADNWRQIRDDLRSTVESGARVKVDLTTMPRETIWNVFWMLDVLGCKIEYSYFRPAGYGDWLSRDPQRPRLIYKLSGITRLRARTALVVLAGYDVDRTKRLMTFFEPEVTLLGLQTLDRDPANDELMRKQQEQAERFGQDGHIECFFLDAYAPDCGETIVSEQIAAYLESHNIIMCSLGPKPSAVSLYRLHRKHRTTALAYAPSKEFSRKYSHGIAEGVSGNL